MEGRTGRKDLIDQAIDVTGPSTSLTAALQHHCSTQYMHCQKRMLEHREGLLHATMRPA